MAKIIMTSEFHVPNGKAYSGYVDYMSRREALMEKEQSGLINDDEYQELLKIEYGLYKLGDVLGTSSLESVNASDSKTREAMDILESGKIFKEGGDAYSRFVDYMSRRQALMQKGETLRTSEERELIILDNKISEYHQKYGADGPVIPGTFSQKHSSMTSHDEYEVKNILTNAQLNNSVLWADVISFETEFLIEEKILDPETNTMDVKRLEQASRNMMDTLMKEEGINGFWYASIHTNKEHVHIHFSTVETKNTRPMVSYERDGVMCIEPRGKRKQKTLDKMRRSFANTLVDRSAELRQISDLRNSLVSDIKGVYKETRPVALMQEVYSVISAGGKYQYDKLDYETKVKLDKLTDCLMGDSSIYKKYMKAVNDESVYRDELYGEAKVYMRNFRGLVYKTEKDSSKDFAKNRMADIHKRLGNALLKEMKNGLPIEKTVEKEVIPPKQNWESENGNYYGQKKTQDNTHQRRKHVSDNRTNRDEYKGHSEKKIGRAPMTSRLQHAVQRLTSASYTEYDMWLAERVYEETEWKVKMAQNRGGYNLG